MSPAPDRETSIRFDLTGAGWADLQFTIAGQASEVVGAGYCTDALGDLLRATLHIAVSGKSAELFFDNEPVEWWLSIERGVADANLATIRLSTKAMPDDEERVVRFQSACPSDEFARAVLKAAKALWAANGADGYEKLWDGGVGFPLRAMQALEAALSSPEPQATNAWSSSVAVVAVPNG